MGTFFISHRDIGAERIQAARSANDAIGFPGRRDLDLGDHVLSLWGPLAADRDNFVKLEGGDFALCSGTFIYRGKTGAEALSGFWSDFTLDRNPLKETHGHFILVLRKNGRIYLANDRLGSMKIYKAAGGKILSASFLSAAQLAGGISPDAYGCYQYVWNESVYGTRTPAREISSLEDDHIHELGSDRPALSLGCPIELTGHAYNGISLRDTAEIQVDRLRKYWKTLSDLFGDRVKCALSGGYDSRLQAALFKDSGVLPSLYTYGGSDDEDVLVARAICEGEGWDLDVIEKLGDKRDPDAFAEIFRKSFRVFDGWRYDGLLSPVQDLEDRISRINGNMVLMNGGLGEVFRNFWYLSDRGMDCRAFVRACFSRLNPASCTNAFNPDDYEQSFVEVISKEVGSINGRLTRSQIEAVYPMVRGRFWTSRDVALNQRLGYAIYPFLETEIIADTPVIPLKHKNYGRLEARMISLVDRDLAGYTSSYGFDFNREPPFSYRMKVMESTYRPIFVRNNAYKLKNMRRQQIQPTLSETFLKGLMDLEFPVMRDYFNIDQIHNNVILNRILTLEYLFEQEGR